MANEITVTAADVRPLRSATVVRAIAGEALTFGAAVYVSSYSGDLPVVSLTAGGAVATANPLGIVVAPSVALSGSSVASGEACDVVTFGPVAGYSGMTSGTTVWVHNTGGVLSSAVGTKSGIVGFSLTPAVVFVRPGLFAVSS